MGRHGIWICTAAVESAVHRHLEDQLSFLADRDRELHALVLAIQDEELSHLHHAEERITTKGPWSCALGGFISWSTDVAIWLSTWGDSTRMSRELAAARSGSERWIVSRETIWPVGRLLEVALVTRGDLGRVRLQRGATAGYRPALASGASRSRQGNAGPCTVTPSAEAVAATSLAAGAYFGAERRKHLAELCRSGRAGVEPGGREQLLACE
jgi:hypothetical protein